MQRFINFISFIPFLRSTLWMFSAKKKKKLMGKPRRGNVWETMYPTQESTEATSQHDSILAGMENN